MKKFLSLIACLAIGFVCGWGIACHMANKHIEEIKAAFPPGYRHFFEEYNDEMMSMTRQDINEVITNVRHYEKAVLKEWDAMELGRTLMVRGLQASVEANDVDAVKRIMSDQVQRFLEAYDEGSYQSGGWKEPADTMAKAFRQNEQSPATDDR